MRDSSGHGKSGSKNSEELRAYLDSDVLGRDCSKTRRTACQHTELIAFSCKAQGILYICHSCTAKRAELFSDHFNTHVFAQKYPTTTWCLLSRNGSPPSILPVWPRTLTHHRYLYVSAWTSIQESIPDGVPDVICVLHTAGVSLYHLYHPPASPCARDHRRVRDDDSTLLSRERERESTPSKLLLLHRSIVAQKKPGATRRARACNANAHIANDN